MTDILRCKLATPNDTAMGKLKAVLVAIRGAPLPLQASAARGHQCHFARKGCAVPAAKRGWQVTVLPATSPDW